MGSVSGLVSCALVLGALVAACDGGKKLSHPAFTGTHAHTAVLKILYW